MTFCTRIVAVVVVLTALVLCVPVLAQMPEIDALRARAEQGDAEAQFNRGAAPRRPTVLTLRPTPPDTFRVMSRAAQGTGCRE